MKECFKIVVDCQHNDEVDIKCGGPYSLGYDFFVLTEHVDDIMNYIIEVCAELGTPILAIYYDPSVTFEKEDKDVWTKERIYECIENNEAGLNFNKNLAW